MQTLALADYTAAQGRYQAVTTRPVHEMPTAADLTNSGEVLSYPSNDAKMKAMGAAKADSECRLAIYNDVKAIPETTKDKPTDVDAEVKKLLLKAGADYAAAQKEVERVKSLPVQNLSGLAASPYQRENIGKTFYPATGLKQKAIDKVQLIADTNLVHLDALKSLITLFNTPLVSTTQPK